MLLVRRAQEHHLDDGGAGAGRRRDGQKCEESDEAYRVLAVRSNRIRA